MRVIFRNAGRAALWSALTLAVSCSAERLPDEAAARDRLLALHAQVLEAHRSGNVDLWLEVEGDDYVSANDGRITRPTLAERRAMREPYLRSTSFEAYGDLREPIVEVSPDGRLGWVIAQVQVRARGTGSDSTGETLDSVWAWIELYRWTDEEWKLVGNVSNRQP